MNPAAPAAIERRTRQGSSSPDTTIWVAQAKAARTSAIAASPDGPGIERSSSTRSIGSSR
jgi:hypothetical protein